ncbi:RNA ligase family protein [Nonomuraea longicatena]|uniref:RNA ligase domain-containing protein n=1 Tax=Nonomuraea longicatena TaxID=83682 RepID=A0ABP3ZAT1_9ACTN
MTLQLSDLYNGGLRALDSATKYPSIPTYHPIEMSARGKGRLLEENPISFTGTTYAHEKVDGSNARIVVLPKNSGWLIGSRDEILTAQGDLVASPSLRIVEALAELAGRIENRASSYILTAYLEVYGDRRTPAWAAYGDGKGVAARLFDVSYVPVDVLDLPIDNIASWRDHGGQDWLEDEVVTKYADRHGLERVPLLFEIPGHSLPRTIDDMYELLQPYRTTRAGISGTPGQAEGIVLTSSDRLTRAKVRFRDYERTIRLREAA